VEKNVKQKKKPSTFEIKKIKEKEKQQGAAGATFKAKKRRKNRE